MSFLSAKLAGADNSSTNPEMLTISVSIAIIFAPSNTSFPAVFISTPDDISAVPSGQIILLVLIFEKNINGCMNDQKVYESAYITGFAEISRKSEFITPFSYTPVQNLNSSLPLPAGTELTEGAVSPVHLWQNRPAARPRQTGSGSRHPTAQDCPSALIGLETSAGWNFTYTQEN